MSFRPLLNIRRLFLKSRLRVSLSIARSRLASSLSARPRSILSWAPVSQPNQISFKLIANINLDLSNLTTHDDKRIISPMCIGTGSTRRMQKWWILTSRMTPRPIPLHFRICLWGILLMGDTPYLRARCLDHSAGAILV